jgi:hypothetical protein
MATHLPPKDRAWIDAKERHHLSDARVQMARELGMNPKKLGKIDNHRQEPWKAPLPEFIERCYEKRFGRARPEEVVSVAERARRKAANKEAKRAASAAPTAIGARPRSSSSTCCPRGG